MNTHAEKPITLFARRLRAAREQFGISQKELGVLAGVDEYCASARINQYERGKHTPDFLTTQNLAKVLRLPTAYFFSEEDDLAELISIYHQLKLKDRREILAVANGMTKDSFLSKV